jgi:DNA-binding NtrC family response regulator
VPSKRILVVDDDASILGLIKAILKREGYEVDTANGGREALAKIELTAYDVIVLDLMMPEVNGLDVLLSLHAGGQQVKCIVILSAGSKFEIATAINPNVFAAFQKPFNIPDLIDAVRGCIEGSCEPVAGSLLPLQPVASAA